MTNEFVTFECKKIPRFSLLFLSRMISLHSFTLVLKGNDNFVVVIISNGTYSILHLQQEFISVTEV